MHSTCCHYEDDEWRLGLKDIIKLDAVFSQHVTYKKQVLIQSSRVGWKTNLCWTVLLSPLQRPQGRLLRVGIHNMHIVSSTPQQRWSKWLTSSWPSHNITEVMSCRGYVSGVQVVLIDLWMTSLPPIRKSLITIREHADVRYQRLVAEK